MIFSDLVEQLEELKRRGVMPHTRVLVRASVIMGPLGAGPHFVEQVQKPLERVSFDGAVVLEGD